MSDFTFIDLFAGIGGFRKAFETLGGECVFTCERDRFCQETYRANFDVQHEIAGDIRKVVAEEIPDHDVLFAGFPCQPFSHLGTGTRRHHGHESGLNDETQGTLFYDILRILEAKRPKAFLLENVRYIRKHDDGRTYITIMRSLEALGYQVESGLVDAKFWVPQTRRRVFFVGFRDPNDFRWSDFRIPRSQPILKTILHPEDGSERPEHPYTLEPDGRVNPKYTISDRMWDYANRKRVNNQNFHYDKDVKGEWEQATTLCRKYNSGSGGSWVRQYALKDTYRPYLRTGEDISTSLISNCMGVKSVTIIDQEERNPRNFTPRECSRLMGFDLPGCSAWKIPVSDTQAWFQFGNSVVVPCVEAIGRLMAPYLIEGYRSQADPNEHYVDSNLSLF